MGEEKRGVKPGQKKTADIPAKSGPPIQFGHFTEAARAYWDSLSSEFAELGVVCELDSLSMQVLCDSFAAYEEAKQKVLEQGSVVTGGRGGPMKNPWVLIRDDLGKTIVRISRQFGMTPASRSAIEKQITNFLAEPPKPETDQPDNLISLRHPKVG